MKWSNLSWSLTKQGVRTREKLCGKIQQQNSGDRCCELRRESWGNAKEILEREAVLAWVSQSFIDDSTVGWPKQSHFMTAWFGKIFPSIYRLASFLRDLPRARFDDLELYIHYRFVPFASAPCCKIRPIYQGWRCCWFCRRMGNPAPESWLKWNARKDKKWIELWSWRCIRLLFPDVTWAALTFSGLWHSYSSYFNHFHIYSNVVPWGTGSRSQQIVINHPGHH